MTLSKRELDRQRLLEEKEERDRARQIILYILKQAGGALGKTKLFKALWLAHLFYAKNSVGYLSGWRIVRLPRGPGIDKGDDLIQNPDKITHVAFCLSGKRRART